MNFFPRKKGFATLLRIAFLSLTTFSIASLWQQSPFRPFEDGTILAAPTATRLQFTNSCNISCTLPPWMQTYFQWHTQRVKNLQTPLQWSRQRLLVIRCLDEDRCGGTADRLKSLPLYLAVAAKTHRVLFLRWTRPFPLESFMVPGDQLNWTVPDMVVPLMDGNVSKASFGAQALLQTVRAARNPGIWLVEGAAQMAGGNLFVKVASEMDDAVKPASTFFHEMFLALFRPAPALLPLVEHQMQVLNLRPNQFVTAHIRAKYPGEPYRETWNLTLLERTVTNAIDCASSLAQSLPVYVASDTLVTLQAAQHYPSKTRVVSHLDANALPHQDPPHLNFAKEDDPSAFFSIFVDLFIMSQSRCVAFGAGGFGRFGSLVSFNTSCQVTHSTRGKWKNCSVVME